MALRELETILLMTNGESHSSLQPLAESITERYSKLFSVSLDTDKKISGLSEVKIVSTSIEEYFRRTKEEHEENVRLQSRKYDTVNESEVRIIKHFLRTVCDPEMFRKFQFDEYFLKMTMTTAVIKFDNEESHIELLSDCLEAICSDDPKHDPSKCNWIHLSSCKICRQ